jgi:hypothetical protein
MKGPDGDRRRACPPRTDDATLASDERALEELVAASAALYGAWGQVLLAGPPRTPGLLTHLAEERAERIRRNARDPEVVRDALLVATQALDGIADELYIRGHR